MAKPYGVTAVPEKRFWDKVTRESDDKCWPWAGFVDARGYGILRRNYKQIQAHRMSWELHFGPPGNLCVCHTCDNRICVNPKHLFLGTNWDNITDKLRKGRQQSKLKPDDIQVIRFLLENSISCAEIARLFNVGRPQISRIKHGKVWKHV